MLRITRLLCSAAALSGTLFLANVAAAQQRMVTVTVNNLAPSNSISFAPLHLGFHSGVFDSSHYRIRARALD